MLEAVTELVKANPLLAGMGGATAAGYVIAHAKALPSRLWSALTYNFSTTLTIYSEDRIFERVNRWLSQHPSTRKMRRLTVAEWRDAPNNPRALSESKQQFGIAPGLGLHLIWRDQRPFFIYRTVNDDKTVGGDTGPARRRQTLTISTPGRSQQPILELLDEIRRVQENKNLVEVFLWNGYDPYLVDRRQCRDMSTVDCDETLKEELIADLRKFLASKELYAQRGTPWRRGYMFEGPPGTGKTTMIFALASLIGKPVYIIPGSAITNDKELLNAINAADDYIVVIEDIDSLRAAESRDTRESSDTYTEVDKAGITLSGLLNAMDGLGAREGRVLFVTTNTPDVIDNAVMRPGRIDVRKHFAKAGEMEAASMFKRFYPDADLEAFLTEIRPRLPLAQAEIQNLLLGMDDTLQKHG